MDANGTWYNELGSKMTLKLNGSSVVGTYENKVGKVTGQFQLVGLIDVKGDPGTDGQAIGWVVIWNNDTDDPPHSVTAWSGRYSIVDGKERIVCLWLLAKETEASAEWSSTRINKDIFTRGIP